MRKDKISSVDPGVEHPGRLCRRAGSNAMIRGFPCPHHGITRLDGNGNRVKGQFASRRDLNADRLRLVSAQADEEDGQCRTQDPPSSINRCFHRPCWVRWLHTTFYRNACMKFRIYSSSPRNLVRRAIVFACLAGKSEDRAIEPRLG